MAQLYGRILAVSVVCSSSDSVNGRPCRLVTTTDWEKGNQESKGASGRARSMRSGYDADVESKFKGATSRSRVFAFWSVEDCTEPKEQGLR